MLRLMRIGAIGTYIPELASSGRTAVRQQTKQAGYSELDTVTLGSGPELAARTPLILPTMKNVRALSAALASDLATAFRAAGIPLQPPIDLKVDGSGRIRVSGRPDAPEIEQRLNSDEKLAQAIRTTTAISSHALGIERSAAFQSEYRTTDNAGAVVAKYADLFGAPQSGEVWLRFDGSGVLVQAGGKHILG